jgi:hypothetical protein
MIKRPLATTIEDPIIIFKEGISLKKKYPYIIPQIITVYLKVEVVDMVAILIVATAQI